MSFSIQIASQDLSTITNLDVDKYTTHVEFNDGSWLVGNLKFNNGDSIVEDELIGLTAVELKSYFDSKCYQYFVIFYFKSLNQLYLLKDFSGCEAGYYKLTSSNLVISDNVDHILSSTVDNEIDEISAFNFIYFEMPWKPQSLFKSINAVLNDTVYMFNPIEHTFEIKDYFEVAVFDENSNLTLRDSITRAHKKRLSTDNAIFLSGGIDSQVMSIALKKDLGVDNLLSYNFSIKGAIDSEHVEAKQTADRLGIEFNHVEVDPVKEVDFENLFLTQNSPYVGAIALSSIFNSIKGNKNLTFFGGQDTRLHTPALTKLDLNYWQMNNVLGLVSKPLLNLLGGVAAGTIKLLSPKERSEKFDRLLKLITNVGKPSAFLTYRHFHIHQFKFIENSLLANEDLKDLQAKLSDLSFSNPRQLYNKIVELNWRKQYMFDIEYMVGSSRAFGFDCVMPFYDKELAQFSANIDFKSATKITKGRAGHSNKTVGVNKFVLREAYKGELDDSLIYRDKAVCPTTYMFFNGALKPQLTDFIYNNPLVGTKLGEVIFINELIDIARKKHMQWQPNDNAILVIIFNAMVIAFQYSRMLK